MSAVTPVVSANLVPACRCPHCHRPLAPGDVFASAQEFLEQQAELRVLRERHASLSRREREVMELVVRGQLNKQVGGELGISEITVKAHRGRVMRKMQARSLVHLVTMAARLRPTT